MALQFRWLPSGGLLGCRRIHNDSMIVMFTPSLELLTAERCCTYHSTPTQSLRVLAQLTERITNHEREIAHCNNQRTRETEHRDRSRATSSLSFSYSKYKRAFNLGSMKNRATWILQQPHLDNPSYMLAVVIYM